MTVPRIRPGVFFTPRSDLPRGRYALDRDEVRAVQRERLMAAFAELVAARGLTAVTVADVVAHAGVSRAAFYACFADLAACADASYDRFISVLLTRLGQAMDQNTGDWQAYVESSVRCYLEALAADTVVARAMQLEMDAAGKPARLRRRQALQLIADSLAARYATVRSRNPALVPLPDEAFLGTVYAVRQLACDALDDDVPDEDVPDGHATADPLGALTGPLLRWIAAQFSGVPQADVPGPDPI